MNRVLKVIILVSLCLILVGVGLTGVGVLTGGKLNFGVDFGDNFGINVENAKSSKTLSDEIIVDPFEEMEVNSIYADVKVVSGSEYKVSYHVIENYKPEITVENGVLKVTSKSNRSFVNFSLNNSKDLVIEITVPENTLLTKMNIVVEDGDVDVSQCHSNASIFDLEYGNVTVKNSELGATNISIEDGNLFAEKSKFETTNFSLEYGTLSVENSELKATTVSVEDGNCDWQQNKVENMTIEIEYGNFGCGKTEFSDLTIINTDGNVALSDSQCQNVTMSLEYGNVEATNWTVASVKASLEDGNCELQFAGKREEYALDISAEDGDVTVDGKENGSRLTVDANAQKSVQIKTEYGDVDIDFAS